MRLSADDPTRVLTWAHGRAELQRLAAMLAPVTFSVPGHADFSPLQVAPWADEPGSEHLPGLMRRLRGDWPCVPFGCTDRPPGLGAEWATRDPGDAWAHGYSSHHEWHWLETDDPLSLCLAIEPPAPNPVSRLRRQVRAVADAPALELTLTVEVRAPCTLPLAVHPTLRLDAGRVALDVPHAGPGHTYPVPAEAGLSRLAPDQPFADLHAVPQTGGTSVDLTSYPLNHDTEELLQLTGITGPVRAHYLDQGWTAQLDWDRALLPDMLLWVSHRGRAYAPWNRRHWAIGLEPVNSAFDVARVAAPPPGHALAHRTGVTLRPGEPWVLRYRLSAQPDAAAA